MNRQLTERQQAILRFIREYTANHGYPPTRAEIARHFGFRVTASAQEHLRALASKGVIALVPGNARGIRLFDQDAEEGIPLVGRVAAGRPILAAEHIEARYQLPSGLFRPMPDFLLEVRGESMIEAGILDGDLLAVRKTASADEGQIVVARLGEEVTVKRLKSKGKITILEPANCTMPLIKVRHPDEFAIEGVAVGVIRRFG